jgi:hypothetical protein
MENRQTNGSSKNFFRPQIGSFVLMAGQILPYVLIVFPILSLAILIR